MNTDCRDIRGKGWIDRVRRWLRDSGTAQESLARSLGCTRGAVGHYLSGRRHPTLSQMENIAHAMGVHPAWLLYGLDGDGIGERPALYRRHELKQYPALRGTTATGPRPEVQGYLNLSGLPPDCYALAVTGTTAWPRAYDGEILLLDAGHTAQPGDDVLVRLTGGETALYELVSVQDERPVLGYLGERRGQRFTLPDGMELMHRVVGVLRRNLVHSVPCIQSDRP